MPHNGSRHPCAVSAGPPVGDRGARPSLLACRPHLHQEPRSTPKAPAPDLTHAEKGGRGVTLPLVVSLRGMICIGPERQGGCLVSIPTAQRPARAPPPAGAFYVYYRSARPRGPRLDHLGIACAGMPRPPAMAWAALPYAARVGHAASPRGRCQMPRTMYATTCADRRKKGGAAA